MTGREKVLSEWIEEYDVKRIRWHDIMSYDDVREWSECYYPRDVGNG